MPSDIETSEIQATLCVLTGGPMREIQVNGKRYKFEMHPWCGPSILKRNGEPLKHQPMEFLYAASQWAQQGQRLDENGLCVWYHDPKPILKHLGGKHFQVLGEHPAERGE